MTARKSIVVVIGLAMSLTSSVTHAMPGHAHLKDAKLLLKTAPESGGAAGLTVEKLQKVQKWMDAPSQKTGQYINHTAGQAVNPGNHGHMRHNPEKVAKALSGNGTVDSAIKNVARLHKIQDAAHNTACLDGYSKITDQMRSEAKRILEYVRKTHRLPGKLPDWVDARGPLAEASSLDDIGRGVKKVGRIIAESTDADTVKAVGKLGRIAAKAATNAAKAAGPAAIVAEGVFRGKDVYDTERAYRKGAITVKARAANHSANAGGMVGGVSGAIAGAWAGAACGAFVGPGGAVVGGIVGCIAGGFGGDMAGTKAGTFLHGLLK